MTITLLVLVFICGITVGALLAALWVCAVVDKIAAGRARRESEKFTPPSRRSTAHQGASVRVD